MLAHGDTKDCDGAARHQQNIRTNEEGTTAEESRWSTTCNGKSGRKDWALHPKAQ